MMLLTDVVYYAFPSVYYHFHDSNIVTSISLDQHRANIRFIDRVYEFAMARSLQQADLSAWRSRMYKHYILNIVLNECIQRSIPATEFAAFGAECGKSIGLSYVECLNTYRSRTGRDRLSRKRRVIRKVTGKMLSRLL